MDFLIDLFLGAVGPIVFLLICAVIKTKKTAAAVNMVFDETNNELTLKKRDCNNRKVLKVSELWNHSINYEPEKYVYTGATVGGVHTGGVHKTGGYNYWSGTSTGTYEVWYDDSLSFENNKNFGGVQRIKLADSKLVANAKNNKYVSRYLQGNTLVLGYKTLSKQECKNIISWLCGEV